MRASSPAIFRCFLIARFSLMDFPFFLLTDLREDFTTMTLLGTVDITSHRVERITRICKGSR
jgi:hypothetical protein